MSTWSFIPIPRFLNLVTVMVVRDSLMYCLGWGKEVKSRGYVTLN
jgi:hypothetical protein